MMRKYIVLFILVCLTILLEGCKDYVDIRTKGTLVPKETQNYRYLMNNRSGLISSVTLPDVCSDDVDIVDSVQQAALLVPLSSSSLNTVSRINFANGYLWGASFYTTLETDMDWEPVYGVIYNANVVISEVLSSINGTTAEKNQIWAEALVHRADAYLSLISTYAKAYDATTSASDPGVPLLLEPSLDAKLNRATVQTVYDQVIDDLKKALPYLPQINTVNSLPSKAAAFALLARTYHRMEKYNEGAQYADSALAIQNTLLDLQQYLNATYPMATSDPEIILSKTASTNFRYSPTVLRLSNEMLDLLGTQDLRYVLFTAPTSSLAYGYSGRAYYKDYLTFENRNTGPSVGEMMLIKAEALARNQDASGAMNLINQLRLKRFKSEEYSDLIATDAMDALVKVLEERRKELFCHGGFRWFDLKRLNKDSRFAKTLKRNFQGTEYTLEPNGNRYVFPIGEKYIQYNPEIEQNPR
ncbi:RagB/SusD family nutrient uptake outer membrane protein [Cytophagaceae bacterium BD1B2-1]|uniref:RagB/SusD family nutrient uptake outer membrane protein n=1 Tax=Xanthocytophaga agilis TaxID=3048010 RepID=A0AAE3REJ4_9BACT|nr:RagB/SusD family nutrient uptake outer membrane protein [Xanthocytophaga agilis]